MNLLQTRLMHCLQTLVELQPFLHPAYGTTLKHDFSILAGFLEKNIIMDLCEEDVSRLECLTTTFLKEIRVSTTCHNHKEKLQ